jgi:hypothetical protein
VANTASKVAIPFDEGVYMNDGGPGSSTNNVDSETVALRDIKAGDEILQDYTEFIDLDNEVEWFAKLRERAFGKYHYTQQGAPPMLAHERDETTSHLVLKSNKLDVLDGTLDDAKTGSGVTGVDDSAHFDSLSQKTMISMVILAPLLLATKFRRVLVRFSNKTRHSH